MYVWHSTGYSLLPDIIVISSIIVINCRWLINCNYMLWFAGDFFNFLKYVYNGGSNVYNIVGPAGTVSIAVLYCIYVHVPAAYMHVHV